jgi:hypothetical protein
MKNVIFALTVVATMVLTVAILPGQKLAAAGNEPKGTVMSIGYGELTNATSCPLMMDLQNVIDDYLTYREQIAITPDQLAALKNLRDVYQKKVLKLNDQHNRAVLKLNNILYDNQTTIKDIREVSAEIGQLEGEIRTQNIETFMAARDILNREQRKKAQEQGIKDYPFEYLDIRPVLR